MATRGAFWRASVLVNSPIQLPASRTFHLYLPHSCSTPFQGAQSIWRRRNWTLLLQRRRPSPPLLARGSLRRFCTPSSPPSPARYAQPLFGGGQGQSKLGSPPAWWSTCRPSVPPTHTCAHTILCPAPPAEAWPPRPGRSTQWRRRRLRRQAPWLAPPTSPPADNCSNPPPRPR